MSHTYAQNVIHVVFSTKGRAPPKRREERGPPQNPEPFACAESEGRPARNRCWAR